MLQLKFICHQTVHFCVGLFRWFGLQLKTSANSFKLEVGPITLIKIKIKWVICLITGWVQNST